VLASSGYSASPAIATYQPFRTAAATQARSKPRLSANLIAMILAEETTLLSWRRRARSRSAHPTAALKV
jgi:hypothetical protein